MALQGTGIGDLVKGTLNELGKMKWTDVSSDIQDHVAAKRLMKRSKSESYGGPEVQFNLMVDNNNSARFTGLYSTDVHSVPDVMIQGKVEWRHFEWSYAWDKREIAMNASPQRIFDLMKTRRIAGQASAVEKWENRFWRAPASTDNETPYGLPVWCVKTATAATVANNDGFNGSVPSGFTTVGNINPTTYDRWKNYADAYTSLTKPDGLRKMRRAMQKTKFKSVVENSPTYNTGDSYGIYADYDQVVGPMEELLESQNEDLGYDLASMDGKVIFRGVPVEQVPALRDDTTGVIYGINWGELKTHYLAGCVDEETVLDDVPGQHMVGATYVNTSMQWVCRNRRRLWVISTGTTMPA